MQESPKGASSTTYKSGNYFNDALSWYQDLYLASKPKRVLYLLVSIVILSSCACSVFIINSFFPLKQKSNLIIQAKEDNQDLDYNISKMDKMSHPNLSVAKYMISDYIKARESYEYKGFESIAEIKDQISKIDQMSSDSVFQDYKSLSDPMESLTYLLQNGIEKNLTIESVTYDSGYGFIDALIYMLIPGKIPSKATAIITQEIKNKKQKYIINVSFYINIPQKIKNYTDDGAEKKVSSMAKYLTGADDKFNPNIDFVITGYDKKKTV
jgi:type IV secretory pathway component VirB8